MKYPLWFWVSIIIFIIGEWAAIPILAKYTHHAGDVVDGILSISSIGYPIYVITVLVLLKRKVNYGIDGFYVTFIILLVPILIYFPFWVVFAELIKEFRVW